MYDHDERIFYIIHAERHLRIYTLINEYKRNLTRWSLSFVTFFSYKELLYILQFDCEQKFIPSMD